MVDLDHGNTGVAAAQSYTLRLLLIIADAYQFLASVTMMVVVFPTGI